MKPIYIILIIAIYFVVLLAISYFTSRKADNKSFFVGDKKSPWYIVAFGMIGASLSGVTFLSVPGAVGTKNFSYMQIVFGYFIGYMVVTNILLPLYYRLNLTSIYTYLRDRFGNITYKTGAIYFLISRVLGASLRLLLIANVLQYTIFDKFAIPFWVSVAITILLIWLYTFRGGIKTIIWTDTLQTLFMLIAVGFTIYFISKEMGNSVPEMFTQVFKSDYSKIFIFDSFLEKNYFIKQIIGGAFITIVMTGLDQDMMQKNLSCRNIKEAKKNMFWFSIILIPINLIFLMLGAMLFIFKDDILSKLDLSKLIDNKIFIEFSNLAPDEIYTYIANMDILPISVAIFFILGLIAAAYSSADSALTSLTTSFSVDMLEIDKYKDEAKQNKVRKYVHVLFSLILFFTILIFHAFNDDSIIYTLLGVAVYTYGPLLGLYFYGIFTKNKVKDKFVPIIAILAPILTFVINFYSENIFFGYKFGFELIVINALLMILGLLILKRK